MLRCIKKYNVESTAFESTSTYHFKLMFKLLEKGKLVLLANPQQTKNTQGKKTDKLDAKRIAVAHRDGRLKPSVISPKSLMQLRRNMRTLLRLISEQTKCKQRLNQLFHQYDFTLHTHEKNLLKLKWSLQLLHDCLALKVSNKNKNINKMISELVDKHYPRDKAKRKAKDYQRIQTLIHSFCDLVLQLQQAPMDRFSFITEVSQIQLLYILADQQRQIYLQYANENMSFANQMKVLLTVPGIGPDTAAILLAEIVDINYFSASKKLAKWAGLAPKVYQSGHRKRITGRIHKGGNKYVRRAMTLVCKNIYARGNVSNPFYSFIKHKYDEKDAYWLAICAGARKMLCVIWMLLKNDSQWSSPVSCDDPEVTESINKLIIRKITAHQRGIRRLEQTQEKLNWALKHQLNQNFGGVRDPKKALRILLNGV